MSYLNFISLEVVSSYRDPQLQVSEICLDLFNLGLNITFLNIDVSIPSQ